MNTYIYTEKNGSAVITLTADNEENAWYYLDSLVSNTEKFRLDSTEKE